MGSPPKRDRWPDPRQWRHVWHKDTLGSYPPPIPGLVLEWDRVGYERWRAWVVLVDDHALGPVQRRQLWVPADQLRPAVSDINAGWEHTGWVAR